MDRVRIEDLPWENYASPKKEFDGWGKQVSAALGAACNKTLSQGGHPFDIEYGRLPLGKSMCPFHSHYTQWELFIIVQGQARVRHGKNETIVNAGDVVMHPPGEAHQIINIGDQELLYFLIADNPTFDTYYYPDSDKWGIKSGPLFRTQEFDYFEGEETDAAPPPTTRTLGPIDADLARFVSIESIDWIHQHSPKSTYDSQCRDISLALGALPEADPDHGGHPFDVQLRKVSPGAAICPFHCHSQQWEVFIIHSGTATARVGEERYEVTAGEVLLRKPGVPHQLLNTSDEPVECYIIANNPPAESVYFPDSDKWMIKPERKIFRMQETDYLDGEE